MRLLFAPGATGEQQVPGISWSFACVEKVKTCLRDPQDKRALLNGLALEDEQVPAWLRQESCLYSLGKSPFAQDSLL